MLTRGLTGAVQRELDAFYKQITSSEYTIREVTKGAFTQARAKLKPSAFKELNDLVNRDFYQLAPYRTWKGRRLVALDGSRLDLPSHSSIDQKYGSHKFGPNADSGQSIALCSMLYDPVNCLCLDAVLLPYKSSEIEAAYMHMDKIPSQGILLADAYYANWGFFFELKQKKIDFCTCARESWKSVKEFRASGKEQAVVRLKLTSTHAGIVKKYGLSSKDGWVDCRFILDEKTNTVLCTSLIGEEHTIEDIIDLYEGRWGIEEAYKMLKSRLNMELFSGKTALAVEQDFFAKIFMLSLTAELCYPVEEKLREENDLAHHKNKKTINKTHALSKLKDVLHGLLSTEKTEKALNSFDQIISKTTERLKPKASNPRKFRLRKHKSINYKPI